MAPLHLNPLEAIDIDPAYALVRLGYPDLALDDWRARAADLLTPAGQSTARGMMAARRGGDAASAILCGLMGYAVVTPVAGPPVLYVERIIAFDLTEPERVARALLDAVFARTGCQAGEIAVRDIPVAGVDPSDRLLASPVAALHRVL